MLQRELKALIPDLPMRHNRFRLFGGAAVLILLVVLAASLALLQLYNHAEARAYAIGQDLSKSLEQTISGIVDTADVALQAAADNIEHDIAANRSGDLSINSHLRRQQARLLPSIALRATNATGDLIYGPGLRAPYLNIANLRHFQLHRDNAQSGLVISAPTLSRLTHQWTWILARRLNNPDGSFAGVVYAAVPIAEFGRMFEHIKLGPQSAITFRDVNFNLVLRYVAPNTFYWPNDDKGSLELFKSAVRDNPDSGPFYNPTAPIDGISRFYYYHRSPKYQFTINVGVYKDIAFADWRRQAWIIGMLVAIFIIASTGFVVAISTTWRRKEKVMLALHKSQRSLLEAQKIANLGQYKYYLNTDYWKSSEVLDNIFGIGPDYPRTAKGWLDLIAPDSRQEMSDYLHQIVSAHQPFDREYRIVRVDDGQERWVHGKGILQLDADGTPLSLIGTIQDISERKQHESQLEHLAYYDVLTKLPNRRLLTDRIAQAIAQSKRDHSIVAVCYLDFDDFKPINDRYGHQLGDLMLIAVSTRLQHVLREGDSLARLGGDEFVLLFTNLSQDSDVHEALSRIVDVIKTPVQIEHASISLTVSIGVTLYPNDNADVDTLLRHADQAMYRAKEDGKNCYRIFDQAYDQKVQERLYYLQRLQQALANQEFALHYQPKVDMRDGTVLGVEALIRWNHPEQGLLSPGSFLQYLEGSELDTLVGEWVIDSALCQMAAWQAMGLSFSVSVNISPAHLLHADFARHLHTLLNKYPEVEPSRLELEILETAALSDITQAVETLTQCRQLGVGISMDDFGTGYSSLTYFRQLPVQTLKIDQSFIRDMLSNSSDLNIVLGVMQLARTFHRTVIAEGVETLEHAAMLMHYDCPLMQGYGIARPMAAEQVPQWIAQWQADAIWTTLHR